MTDLEDNRNPGGNSSTEKETEYREEARHSVVLSSEGHSVGDTKKNSDADASTDGDVSESRKSREELESQFRNDPRFTMLFGTEEKKSKTIPVWSIKVGGLRLTSKRLLILGGFFLVILLCLGICLFYAVKDLGKMRDYSRATAYFKAGDYESAKKLFIKVIAEDPNKEDALAAFADICHHYGDWNSEAFFRQRLMRLNPLDQKLRQEFLESAFRARNFGVIYSLLNLKVMDEEILPQDDGALYLISALYTGHDSKAKVFYDAMLTANRNYFSDNELGRFADMLIHASNLSVEQVQEHFANLDSIQDPQVRFETINTLLFFLSKREDAESEAKMEEMLKEAATLNSYAGAPLLANYYFSRYRFEDTIKVCDDYLKTRVDVMMPILYGESCILTGQSEMIPPFSDRIRALRGRQSKIISSYLDALYAFSNNGDTDRLRRLLLEAGDTIKTPLFSLMKLHIALQGNSPKEIRQTLSVIMKGTPFLDFQQRARSAALQYLLKVTDSDLLSDPELLNDCAEIALLIQTPDDNNSFFKRIILIDRFMRNILPEDDLLAALETFPGDNVLLRIAAEFYLTNGQPARAMDFISEYNALPDAPNKSAIAILHMLALNQLGRKEEAEMEFRTIVEQNDPDGVLLPFYFGFCVENKHKASLETLYRWLDTLPADSPKRSAMPFVRAEILLADGENDKALDLFAKSDSSDPFFVFHAAARLAEAGRTDNALARYRSIMDTYPDKSLVNIRLSRLYTEKGDSKAALACAQSAWQENPEGLQPRYIYAKCLFDEGQYGTAINVLKFPQYHAHFPDDMLKLWADAMRKQILFDFDNARYTPVQENLKHLLIYFPEDEFALDYTKKMEIIRRQSKNLGDGK